MHVYNISTWEAESGGFWIQGQPGLYETMYIGGYVQTVCKDNIALYKELKYRTSVTILKIYCLEMIIRDKGACTQLPLDNSRITRN